MSMEKAVRNRLDLDALVLDINCILAGVGVGSKYQGKKAFISPYLEKPLRTIEQAEKDMQD